MPDPAAHPPQRRHKSSSLLRDVSIWAGVASAVVAVIGAFFAYTQSNAAAEQNRAAQEQSLSAIVIDITHQTLALAKASPAQAISIDQARLADAEEGLSLVETLHGQVPTLDDYELGIAFEGSNEYQLALESLAHATSPGNDIHYRAASLLSTGYILYLLGGAANDKLAYTDDQLAVRIQAAQPDIPRSTRDTNIAFAELRDAQNGASAHCVLSRQEIAQAKAMVTADPAALTNAVQQALAAARQRTSTCVA